MITFALGTLIAKENIAEENIAEENIAKENIAKENIVKENIAAVHAILRRSPAHALQAAAAATHPRFVL